MHEDFCTTMARCSAGTISGHFVICQTTYPADTTVITNIVGEFKFHIGSSKPCSKM